MQTYKIESRNLEKPLLAVLADLEELWPDEIHITDYVEVSCASQRACVAVGSLVGDLIQQDRGDSDQLTHVLEEQTYHREQARLQPAAPEPAAESESSTRTCPVCGAQFKPERQNQKFCSKKCAKYSSNHRYLNNKRRLKNAGSAEETIKVDPWLDQQSGEILDIQTINQRMRAGTYKPGKRLIRSGNRIYIVEKSLRPSGVEKFRLKRIYE